MSVKRQFLCGMILIFGSGVSAETLSWDQVISEAFGRNADVSAAEKAAESARFLTKVPYGAFLPKLSASLLDRYNASPGVSSAMGPDSAPFYEASLNFEQSLFAGFRDVGKVKEAGANKQIADANLQIVKAKLLFELRTTYAQLLIAQQQKTLAADILKRRRHNSSMVDLRFQAGRENKGSFLLTLGQVHEAELGLEQVERAEGLYQRGLANLLGRETASDLNVAGELRPGPVPEAPDFEALARATPTIRSAEAQTRVSKAQLTQAWADFSPDLKIKASIADQGANWYPHDSKPWSVGLVLDIPLFSGGSTHYNVQSARAKSQSSEMLETQAARNALYRLQKAYIGFLDLSKRVKVEQELLEATATRAMIARAKYAQGLMSFDDWSIVENDLIDRQKTILDRRLDLAMAEAEWYQALGSTEGLE